MRLQPDVTHHGASFSDCGRYRYRLWRTWDSTRPSVAFVGLNPSTATGDEDDPTIRKCITLARAWGFGQFTMLNAFAWRSTDSDGLLDAGDPVGRDNDRIMARALTGSTRIVLAWGRFPKLRHLLEPREHVLRRMVSRRASEVGHLGLNGDGSPKHPLYLRSTTPFTLEAC